MNDLRIAPLLPFSLRGERVLITGANNGGLTANLGGVPIFVPVSQLERKPDRTWWTAEVSPSGVCL